MSETSACPNSEQLQQLILGQLPNAASDALEQHLEQCPRCEDTIEVLKADDTLVALVRARGAELLQADPPEVTALISKLSQAARPADEPLDLSTTNTIIERSITPANVPAGDIRIVRPSGSEASSAEQPPRALYDFLAPPQAPDELGRLGPYRVLKVLGAGGMGVVFLAEDPQLQRRVALKAMKPSLAVSESARIRFLREARTTAAIEHDHIVTIYQVGDDRGVPFLAMQFLHGESLEDRLRRERSLPLADVLRIGREVALGLAAAHKRGLIHRDIKPANIWLETRDVSGTALAAGDAHSPTTASAGAERSQLPAASAVPLSAQTPTRAKILDFGLARATDDELHLTQTGTVAGTPAYMAPEQAQGEHVDHRADLFSLGAMLYRLCTGELPFKGANPMAILMAISMQQPKPPRDLNPDLPEAVSDLILRLLAKQPSERPQSAREVVEAIAAIEHQTTATTAAGGWALLPVIPNATGKSAHPPSPTPPESPATPIRPASRVASAPGCQPSPATSEASRPPARPNLPWWTLAAAVLLLVLGPLGYYFGATVIRIVTNKGQIVIETDGAGVEVVIKDQQGTVFDPITKREITFKAGDYNIEVTVTDSGGEQRFVTDHFVLKRNGKKTVDARWETAKAKPTAESADPDRHAAEWVLSIGGTISIKENGKERQTGAVGDLPQAAFELTVVELLQNPKASDAGLAHFKDCKNLTYLSLHEIQVSDAGLVHFKDCKNLAYLNLNGTQVSDAGLVHFKDCKNLTSLHVYHTQVSDAGMAHFKECKNLTNLSLGNTQVSDAGLERLASFPRLVQVYVNNTKVTEAGVKKLSAALPGCKIEWDGGVIEPRTVALLRGDWRIVGDVIKHPTKDKNSLLLFGSPDFGDGDFTCEVLRSDGGNGLALVARATDLENYYYFEIGSFNNQWHSLYAKEAGANWRRIDQKKAEAVPSDRWVKIRLKLRGDTIEGYLDDQLVVSGKDARRLKGYIGLRTWNETGKYRNLKLTSPDGKVLWQGLPEIAVAEPSADPDRRAAESVLSIGGKADPAPSDYDKLATGRWMSVLTDRGATVEPRNATFINGLVEIRDGHAYEKSILAADVIVRAKVQKLSGQNVMLTLRDVKGVYYSAFYHFDGAEGFGVGMRGVRFHYGVKQHFEASAGVKEGEFFELAFSAVGDMLTVYANGKRVGEIRDSAITQSGGVAIHTTKGKGVFKDVEVMILDKPAP